MKKNSIKYWVIGLIWLNYACDTKNNTGYSEIDDKYKFKKSEVVLKEDVQLQRYFLDSESDSVYTVIKNSKDEVSRGWTSKFVRIGDWFFEHKNHLDSIYNYINYCGGIHHVNTIQYFVDGRPLYDKGYWFEVSYDTLNLKENKPIDIDIKVNYDKALYEKNIALYFFKESISNADYCYFKELKKDSLPSFEKDYYSFEITPKYKGKHAINGYFVLLPIKQSNPNNRIELKPVFFKLDLNVK